MGAQPLLKIENLVKHFHVKLGAFGERSATVYALDNVNLDIMEGETLSLVGESGCGKSTTGFTILNLYKATSGKVVYKGQDLATLDEKQMRPFRRDLQIVFQDPYSTLNPRMTVGEAIGEPILFHKLCTKAELKDRVTTLLTDVGLPTRLPSATRTSFPAVSASASSLPARSPASRNSSSATRRFRRSTCRSRHRSSTCCSICRKNTG